MFVLNDTPSLRTPEVLTQQINISIICFGRALQRNPIYGQFLFLAKLLGSFLFPRKMSALTSTLTLLTSVLPELFAL